MAKQRPSVLKRQREQTKRQREQKKALKAAEKRERRLNGGPQDGGGYVIDAEAVNDTAADTPETVD